MGTPRHDRSQALRESSQRLLAALGHPVHYALLAGVVWADSGLRPSNGELLAALRVLTASGAVRRVRPAVYQATRQTLSESKAAPAGGG